jgi:hypothetical protein
MITAYCFTGLLSSQSDNQSFHCLLPNTSFRMLGVMQCSQRGNARLITIGGEKQS